MQKVGTGGHSGSDTGASSTTETLTAEAPGRSASEEIAPPIIDGKAIEGKDGWLFLAHDAMNSLGQHTGTRLLSDQELHDWRMTLETRTAWLEQRGIHHFFLLSVGAHALYPEMLPDDMPMAAIRTPEQLMNCLEANDSPAEIIYPLQEILAAKEHKPVGCRTSSHWNAVGAYAAYRKLMGLMSEKMPAYSLPEERVEYYDAERFSDLGSKMEPPRKSWNTFANVAGQRARLVSDNFVLRRGRLTEFECPDAPDSTVLLLGDSFSYQMMNFLAESFRRLIFAHLHTLDFELTLEYEPTAVLVGMNERGLNTVMYDLPATNTRQFARKKIARGEVDSGSGRIWRASPTAPAVDKSR